MAWRGRISAVAGAEGRENNGNHDIICNAVISAARVPSLTVATLYGHSTDLKRAAMGRPTCTKV